MSDVRLSPEPRRSAAELRLKTEFERARVEIARLKAELDRGRRKLRRLEAVRAETEDAPGAGTSPESAVDELVALRTQVAQLTVVKRHLNALYASQVEDNREHARRMHQVLESLGELNASVEINALLARITETMRSGLGFRAVRLYVREPGSTRLHARALPEAQAAAGEMIEIGELKADLGGAFAAGCSVLVSLAGQGSDAPATVTGAGTVRFSRQPHQERAWRPDDWLLVPLIDRSGELTALFSVGDPVAGRVPSRNSLLLLEGFAQGALMVLENARIYGELEHHRRRHEESERRVREMLVLRNQFLATVAHELRRPHTAIQSYVDALLTVADTPIPAERLRTVLANLRHESQWLGWLTDCMADLARGDSELLQLEPQAVDLIEIAEESVRLLENAAQAGKVGVVVERETHDARLHADRDQMRQLMLHLGSNAVKFTPGGTVTFRLLADAESVTVQVEDTGAGIAAAALERIFDRPYGVDFSPSERGGRRGLGLAMVKSIVEWHGGSVSVTSRPGQGSCFRVVLPRHRGLRVIVPQGQEPQALSDELARLVVRMVSEVMNARVVSLMVPDERGDLVIRAATGLDETVVSEARVQPGTGVSGWVARHRRPMCVTRPGEVQDARPSRHKEYRSGSFLSVPLEWSGVLLGVLNVTDPASRAPFDAEDCHLMLQLAQRIASAWEQARRDDAKGDDIEGAIGVPKELLRPLDGERASDPARSQLARELGRELGLPESEIGVISFAAGLGDVSLAVLREEAGGRTGPVALEDGSAGSADGAAPPSALLGGLDVVRSVLASQHEWWDGTGYPRGLEGTEIPLGGRILTAINAHEELVRARLRGGEEASGELANLSGTRLDPDVVAALVRVLERREPQASAAA
jgi:signal transduction histidine kinase